MQTAEGAYLPPPPPTSDHELATGAPPPRPSSPWSLEDAAVEQLAEALSARLAGDRMQVEQLLEEVKAAERQLEQRQDQLEELEAATFGAENGMEDVVDLNVGGRPMSTTRAVLCSARGSLLAGMFSGHFDARHKRDKEGRIFLDVDPEVFAKLLSHLRLRRISSPDCPAPLPHIPEDVRGEYDMMVRYFGLESFMYGDVGSTCDVFQRLAELGDVEQSRLQSKELIRIILSSTGGVPAMNHEEVFGTSGFHERALENSYGAYPNSITVRFLKHWVCIEGMQLRAKVADVLKHMSSSWTFRQGNETPVNMGYQFTRAEPCSGRLDVPGGPSMFVDEIAWFFPRDFCLEHIVLYGRVLPK